MSLYPGNITFHAYQLQIMYGSTDPFVIAKKSGAIVEFIDISPNILKAKTEFINNKPYISINSNYTALSQKLLCAHELGHVCFHPNQKNEYKNIYKGYFDPYLEYEANLFAVAFMFGKRINKPIAYLDEITLQNIIDKNIVLNK